MGLVTRVAHVRRDLDIARRISPLDQQREAALRDGLSISDVPRPLLDPPLS